jgi:hypothetical protein
MKCGVALLLERSLNSSLSLLVGYDNVVVRGEITRSPLHGAIISRAPLLLILLVLGQQMAIAEETLKTAVPVMRTRR